MEFHWSSDGARVMFVLGECDDPTRLVDVDAIETEVLSEVEDEPVRFEVRRVSAPERPSRSETVICSRRPVPADLVDVDLSWWPESLSTWSRDWVRLWLVVGTASRRGLVELVLTAPEDVIVMEPDAEEPAGDLDEHERRITAAFEREWRSPRIEIRRWEDRGLRRDAPPDRGIFSRRAGT